MEVELSNKNIMLLDMLRKHLADIFRGIEKDATARAIEKADYNQLVMMLHYGFSEKAFIESAKGIFRLGRFEFEP